MSSREWHRLYLVVGESDCRGKSLLKVVEAAVKGGVDIVQLREKDKEEEAFLDLAKRLGDMLSAYQVPLIINDNLTVAKNCRAAGLHVGNSDMPPSEVRQYWPESKIVGYSIEYLDQLQSSESRVADYLAASPVFSTPTKTDTVTEWGLDGIAAIRKLTEKPLVAIGRMNKDNAREVIVAGADCLAVVSAICGADNPALAAERIRNEIEKAL